jgi:hypothetical protein
MIKWIGRYTTFTGLALSFENIDKLKPNCDFKLTEVVVVVGVVEGSGWVEKQLLLQTCIQRTLLVIVDVFAENLH